MKNLKLLAAAVMAAASMNVMASDVTVTNIGNLGSTSTLAANEISENGLVTGYASVESGYSHAFRWDGEISDIDQTGYSFGFGINQKGTVAGATLTQDNKIIAAVFSGDKMETIGTLGGSFSVATGINDKGLTVGYSRNEDNATEGFIYRDGEMSGIGSLGGSSSFATGVSQGGVIGGYSSLEDDSIHAMIYEGGEMIDLGTLGGRNSYGMSINDNGFVVGHSQNEDGDYEAFFGNERGLTGLGSFGGDSYGLGANNSGMVVGYSFDDNGEELGFIWSASLGMVDLNSYTEGTDWVIQRATDINDAGQIIGLGTYAGENAMFIMDGIQVSAVPEPSTYLLMLLGLAAVGFAAKKKKA